MACALFNCYLDTTTGSVRPEVQPEAEDVLVNRIHSIVESVAHRRPTIIQKTSGFIHSVFRRPRERRQIVQVDAPDLSSAAGARPTTPEDDAIWRNFMRNRKLPASSDLPVSRHVKSFPGFFHDIWNYFSKWTISWDFRRLPATTFKSKSTDHFRPPGSIRRRSPGRQDSAIH